MPGKSSWIPLNESQAYVYSQAMMDWQAWQNDGMSGDEKVDWQRFAEIRLDDEEIEARWNKEEGIESNAVGNYTDPAILKEYDEEMEKAEPFYVNQDIRLEPKKSQVGDKNG